MLRIGEVSNRTGVSPNLLRAWERRYGLLQPARSAGGLRLYTGDDLGRVRSMQRHLAEGVAAAEAARLALGEGRPAAPAGPHELAAALDRYDEPAAQAIIDRLLATQSLDTFLGDVVVPFLAGLGDRWERGEVSVAQEHFASAVIRGRLLGLARGWGLGIGPLALLACLPGERHELGLLTFGLALRARGWRIVYLGTDAPLETIRGASRRLQPALVVLSAVTPERVAAVAGELAELAAAHRVVIGGAGAAASVPGVTALTGDLISEASVVTASA